MRRIIGTALACAAAALGVAAPAALAQGDGTKGKILADSGFRAPANGYSFPNYGNEPGVTDLRPDEMRQIFGEAVCSATADGRCVLSPAAEAWMEHSNAAMADGHCFGFAFTSQRWFEGIGEPPTPEPFGSSIVPGLDIVGNTNLQSHIAEAWSLQQLPEVRRQFKVGPPSAIVDLLAKRLDRGSAPYALLIFDEGGHAITPVAVSKIGEHRFRILVYDNNHPDETRAVVVDAKRDTWRYVLGEQRSLVWSGDAKTKSLMLVPIRAGLGVQRCRFCGTDPAASAQSRRGIAPPGGRVELRWSADPATGEHGSLFVTDDRGGRAGCGPGGCEDTIRGAELYRPVVGAVQPWTLEPPPIFDLPGGRDYVAKLSGAPLRETAEEGVELIGRGFTAGAQGIELRRGEADRLRFAADGHEVTFVNDRHETETPEVTFGTAAAAADYEFSIQAQGVRGGASVAFSLDPAGQVLAIDPESRSGAGAFTLRMTRTTPAGEEVLSDEVTASSGDRVEIDYGAWAADDQPVPVG
jgi:hypothetical protein